MPSRRTRDPDDIDISWTLGPYRFELPLLAAAMDGVVSPATAAEVGRLGGLAVLIALIGFGGGFIPATAILFATTSAAFGRKAFMTDLLIGFGLAFVIFLIFDKLLTLSLPSGPLERLL